MKNRQIGSANFAPITFGCMAVADPGVWGPQDEKETIDAMHAAWDLGMTSFDTAASYGAGFSEQLVGKAFGNRADVIIADKIPSGKMRYDEVIAACEESLKNLQRESIDLYQIHWPSKTVPFAETAEALLKLQKDGKIREIGVSNFGVEQLAEMEQYMQPKSNQLMYNLFFRAPEFAITALHEKYGMGMLTYSSLAQGLLTGKYATLADVPVTLRRTRHYPASMNPASPHKEAGMQPEAEKALADLRVFCADNGLTMAQTAIAWLLKKDAVTTVIAGARSIRQVQANALAMQTVLTDAQEAELDALSAPLKEKIGANLDAWRGTADIENRRIR